MPRSLNVLHVIASLGTGGVERHLVQALSQFEDQRLHHHVACVTAGGVYEERLRSLGILYRVMTRRIRFDPTVISQLAALMREWTIDVVHTRNFTANAWGRTAARFAGVRRIIAHERGTAWTETAPMRWLDRRLYGVTDVLLANSEAAKLMLIHHVRVPPDRIRVIHNGLPIRAAPRPIKGRLRSELGIGAAAPFIGAVGRLDTPKGLPFLVDTVRLVLAQRPEAHFAVIGDGPLRPYLTEALASYKHAHLLGFRMDAPAIMGDFDVLLHPAVRESLGNVLMEAGMAGVPAVATAVDGIPEVIKNGETGWLIPGTEVPPFIRAPGVSPMPTWVVDGRTRQLRPPRGPAPEALTDALISLLDDPQRRAELGYRAQRRIREHFSLARYVRQVTAIYLEDAH